MVLGGGGGDQNRPAPKDDLCSILFRCGLSFLRVELFKG